jgi:hypothetical protein
MLLSIITLYPIIPAGIPGFADRVIPEKLKMKKQIFEIMWFITGVLTVFTAEKRGATTW